MRVELDRGKDNSDIDNSEKSQFMLFCADDGVIPLEVCFSKVPNIHLK